MALEKGQKAPDFTLKSKNAEGLDDVKLSNNYGNKNDRAPLLSARIHRRMPG